MYERVKEMARRCGMTLDDLGEKAGLGKGSIRNWRDSVPNVEAVAAVARVLNTTVDYLVNGGKK